MQTMRWMVACALAAGLMGCGGGGGASPAPEPMAQVTLSTAAIKQDLAAGDVLGLKLEGHQCLPVQYDGLRVRRPFLARTRSA